VNTTNRASHSTSSSTSPQKLIQNRVADLAALSHLFNGVGSAAAAGIGYLVTVWYYSESVNVGVFVSVFVATLVLSNGGFIVNDIIDLPIDRINRPDRPLAAGRVSVGAAWALYLVYTLVGMGLSFAINPATGLLALVTAGGLFLYSAALKRQFVLGHAMIGFMGALLFPFGGVAAGHLLPALYSTPFIFAAFFAREVLKTVPDAEGDRANGVSNVTTRYGVLPATRLAQFLLGLVAATLPLLRLVWVFNPWFLVAVFLVVWPFMAFLILRLAPGSDPDHRKVNTVLRLSKLLFLLVALVILIGSLQL